MPTPTTDDLGAAVEELRSAVRAGEHHDEELRTAVEMVEELLDPDQVIVICGSGMYVAAHGRYANGTFQVTCKRKEGTA